ncbi:MAG: hypothetical protein WA655_20675 [Candidatus Korobacteraceae bacterium]
MIVNATPGIDARPSAWFAQDKLVTDYVFTNANLVGRGAAINEYEATRERLSSYGLAVGTYISGTMVIPEARETNWPWTAVPLEWMPAGSQYIEAGPNGDERLLIDLTESTTRSAFQLGIERLWKQTPAPVRFIDNAAVHRSAGRGQPWTSYCTNIEEIRKLGDRMGSRQIFNVAMHAGEMSDEETRQLIEAVGDGGIALEMPWHDNIRNDPAATERAKRRYRELLDSGMAIIMAPPGAEPSQQLVDWVRTWRKPADHLYFAGAFYKPPDMKLFGDNQSK